MLSPVALERETPMPNNVGARDVSFAFYCQQAHLKLAPYVGEVIGQRADDRLRGFCFERFKDLPVVISLKSAADPFPCRVPLSMCYPIKKVHCCPLSARQEKRAVVQAQYRSQALLRK